MSRSTWISLVILLCNRHPFKCASFNANKERSIEAYTNGYCHESKYLGHLNVNAYKAGIGFTE